MSKQLICFDLGGVIVQLCADWAEACLRARVDYRPVRYDEVWEPQLANDYQEGHISLEQFVQILAQRTPYSQQEIEAIHLAWIKEEYSGLWELVQKLKAQKIKTAALSNTCEGHWASLLQYPTISQLDYCFASHLIRAVKPKLQSYLAVEEATGFRAEEIVFFDDRAENIQGAKNRGWEAHLIDPHANPARQLSQILGL